MLSSRGSQRLQRNWTSNPPLSEMSAGQGETDQQLSFAKGVKAAHVVDALHAPVLVCMFGRLYNVRQSL